VRILLIRPIIILALLVFLFICCSKLSLLLIVTAISFSFSTFSSPVLHYVYSKFVFWFFAVDITLHLSGWKQSNQMLDQYSYYLRSYCIVALYIELLLFDGIFLCRQQICRIRVKVCPVCHWCIWRKGQVWPLTWGIPLVTGLDSE
jgi:hypothetical protein